MLVKIKAIVLTSIKFGESDLIVKCYTEEGIKTYMLKRIFKSKSKSLQIAYFQPLTQLEISAVHNSKGNLNSIREARVFQMYTSIPNNIAKQSIVFFLSEILSNSLKEEGENLVLFNYISTALQWLDTHDKSSNFHLLFLLNLTKHLGFYPKSEKSESFYFDLLEGEFTTYKPLGDFIQGENLNVFKALIGTNFDVLEQLNLNAKKRQMLLDYLINYYQLHLPGFKKPKSLSILKEIFQ